MNYLATLAIAFLAGGGPTPAPKQTSTPEVYLYGNVISAPFRTELTDAVVRINGIQIYPPMTEPTRTPIAPTPTPAQSAQHELSQEGWALKQRMEQEGKCCGEIARAMAEFYSKSDLVANVRDIRDNSFWVRWTNGTEEEILVATSKRAQTPEQEAAEELQFINHVLEQGCIVIVASSGRVIVPASDAGRLAKVRAEIALARRTSVEVFGSESNKYRDSRWEGEYLPSSVARQFARPLKLTTQPQEN